MKWAGRNPGSSCALTGGREGRPAPKRAQRAARRYGERVRGAIAWLAATALLAPACRTATAAGASAPEKSCVIVGGPKAPAEVRIYTSPPYGVPGGTRLFIGLLNRNERQHIQSTDGTIWYAYRWHEGDTWREGSVLPCRNGAPIDLP
jgi:hypothetical protein